MRIDPRFLRLLAVVGLTTLASPALAEHDADCAAPALDLSVALAPLDGTPQEALRITLCTGHALPLQVTEPLETLVIGDREVLSAQMAADDLLLMTGLTPGQTNLILLNQSRQLAALISVDVKRPSPHGNDTPEESAAPEPAPAEKTVVRILRGAALSLETCTDECLK